MEQVTVLCKGQKLSENKGPVILDLGTGCGALAVSLAGELEDARIWGSDISAEALPIARLNARKHEMEDRIEFKQGDLWQPFMDLGLTFDIILSNPPYIASEDFDSLPPEVRDHEPRTALDGREHGMFFIEKIIMEGVNYLNSGGWLLLEMSLEQTTKALTLIEKCHQYGPKKRLKDYSHQYRIVMVQKK